MLKIKSYVRTHKYTYYNNMCKQMTGYSYKDYVDGMLFRVFIWRDPETKIWHCTDENSAMLIKKFITYVDVVEFVSSDELYDWYRKMIKSRKYINNVKKFTQCISKLEKEKEMQK